ncbi:hypothetical protein LTR91_023567 [Friedmanniomyces endolithicus]|uniref:Uncharacterized protein n=1 Tax=Friedmanniomyces endolithicus TaxID=329885 RepID=A0AAN6JY79_9PEZI|nr:hypothetical protein LTS02_017478 [Friedmanniomyces endolithicus]KAK0904003.1 hypothetical protein LTR57_018926 [Friedmanniomyces endolithicus]KAK0953950.1 hypothetical protein LTR91_023567 [Friedmanniomyces endolithicus]KAK0957415.1 hypothetical protein LTS01_022369 [Friedmanniomyces endolithicus]KAK1026624.1 hypothetical protein LTS16_022169 [Friedmanniomyces endolithicus]
MPDRPGTPSQEGRPGSGPLDLSLLDSSPPDGTELRQANTVLQQAIERNATLETPVKRYISRATLALEKTVSENTLLRKENTEQRELLETRKKRTKGKRVAIEGRFVFNTEEILEGVRKAEAEGGKKRPAKRRRKGQATIEIEEDVENDIKSVPSEAESDCIVVARRR